MNIIRLYNQNRKQIFIVLLIIASIIAAIHFVNYLVEKDNKENLNSGISSSSNKATTTYQPQKSAISSSVVSDKTYKAQSQIIDEFVKYCNEGNSKEAYNLLSNDCKDALFPTLEYFINNYQKMIFNEEKIYTLKNWTGNIYRVNLTSNMLATGNSNKGTSIEDYFTIVTQDKENKLNINGFINRVEINKTNSKNDIALEVLYKDVYMDYITYSIKASNRTDKTILLDSGENTQNMYLVDENNVKYMSYRNEIPDAQLKVLPYSDNKFQIKYASAYTTNKQISLVVFNDIITNFNEYNEYILKGNYRNRVSIKVEV